MVTDYEAAWVALGEVIAGKTQHGQTDLLRTMATLAAEYRVPAGELSRLLRLHGVEVERARSIAAESRSEIPDFADGLASSSDPVLAAHHRPGGHDGYARSASAGNGAGGRDAGRREGDADRA